MSPREASEPKIFKSYVREPVSERMLNLEGFSLRAFYSIIETDSISYRRKVIVHLSYGIACSSRDRSACVAPRGTALASQRGWLRKTSQQQQPHKYI